MSQQQSFGSGGSSPPTTIQNVIVQTGTTPVVPVGGTITFNGAVVAAGTHPVRTDGTAAHVMALEVQVSQAVVASDVTRIGLANFSSSDFTVDANGFVQLHGSASNTITTNGLETKTIQTIIPSNNSVNTIEVRISGYGTPIGVGADSGIGGTISAVFITGTVSSATVDDPDYFQQSNLGLTCQFQIIADPTPLSKNILIQVTGDASYNINWVCESKLTQAV